MDEIYKKVSWWFVTALLALVIAVATFTSVKIHQRNLADKELSRAAVALKAQEAEDASLEALKQRTLEKQKKSEEEWNFHKRHLKTLQIPHNLLDQMAQPQQMPEDLQEEEEEQTSQQP